MIKIKKAADIIHKTKLFEFTDSIYLLIDVSRNYKKTLHYKNVINYY